MDNGMGLLVGYLIVSVVLFFIAVYTIRAIFSISTLVRNSEAQTKLLAEIANAQKVPIETIKTILAYAEIR